MPCEKCHADIAAEYQNAFAHPLYAPHKTYSCSHCHRLSGFGENNGTGVTYASGDGNGSTAGQQAHAAVAVECMDCHDLNYMWGRPPPPPGDHHKFNPQYQTQPPGQNPGGGPYPGCGWGGPPEKGPRNCHAPPRQQDNIAMIRAGGFGLTDFDNMSAYYYFRTWQNDTGEKAAHRKFVLDAINSTLMEGANEACVACHTKVGVNITWTKNEYLEFTVIEDEAGNWTIPGFTAGGENVTYVNSSNGWTNP